MSLSNEKKKDLLDSIYYARGQAGSFGSAYPLWKASQLKSPGLVSINDVKEYLKSQRIYTVNKRLLRRHDRRKYLALMPFEYLQLDVIYLSPIKKISKKKRLGNYGLIIQDVFSKKANARKLSDKTAASALRAFKEVLNEWGIVPSICQTDSGGEFSGVFRKWCESQKIRLYQAHTNVKSALVENLNGQLKRLISKEASFFNSSRWGEFLSDAVSTYNSNPSKALPSQMSPNEAAKEDNISILQTFYFRRRAQYAKKIKKKYQKRSQIKIGDLVRVLKDHYAFERGFQAKYSDEIYSVESITNTVPYMVKVKDGPTSRAYYENEVSRVYKNDTELAEPKIMSIKSVRKTEEPSLRSGKVRRAPTLQFLTAIEGVKSLKFLSELELKKYTNGEKKLEEFLSKQPK